MCKNMTTQAVPFGYGYKNVKMKCGDTGYGGEQILCDSCRDTADKEYPQGWRNTPGDICSHGNYVGDACGPDYLCGKCEDGL